MVDYLARMAVVQPTVSKTPGRGRRRIYSFGDLVTLRVVKRLLSAGVSVAKLKRSLVHLQKAYGKNFTDTPADYLCTDGKNVYLKSAGDVVSDITRGGQMVFTFMLDLRQFHAETQNVVRKLKLEVAA